MRLDRMILPRLTLLLLIVSGSCGYAAGQVDAVLRIGMTVQDLDRSVAFYTNVLDFKKVSEVEIAGEAWERTFGVFGMRARVATLTMGNETIELTEYLLPLGRGIPRDSRSNDGWFQHIAIVTTDIDRMYQRLRSHKVRHASTGPQTLPAWNPNAGGIKAFYFHDPDGHVLEIIQFPPGKGDPRWQERVGEGLLLGIDHTAIVVGDTDASVQFYRDLLGLQIVGESENWGTEQEHLNNVFGARLRITTLKAPAGGPGVELLEYLTPRDGRQYPRDATPNDLFHWHTIMAAPDPETLFRDLASNRSRLLSRDVVEKPETDGGYRKAFLVRDPDGHAVMVAKP
jgi:catechol 2,3-dioxygenase-like lactoylglutathione lyase family enzyme